MQILIQNTLDSTDHPLLIQLQSLLNQTGKNDNLVFELINFFIRMPENVIDKIIDKASSIADMANEIKEAGSEQINEAVSQIADSTSILNKSGFKLSNIGLSMSLPPDVSGTFTFERVVPDDEWEILFEESSGKPILNAVLKALYKAERISDSLSLANFGLGTVNIKFSIPPSIQMSFKPKG